MKWSCETRTSDYNLRASLVLVAIEAVYVGLHIKPLMPLLGEGKADESSNKFMICYTTPHFFATEVLQFLVLLKTQAWYAPGFLSLHYPYLEFAAVGMYVLMRSARLSVLVLL